MSRARLRWLLEVAVVWLMPWRAVAHATDLEESVTFLLRTFIIQHAYREQLEERLGLAPRERPGHLHIVV